MHFIEKLILLIFLCLVGTLVYVYGMTNIRLLESECISYTTGGTKGEPSSVGTNDVLRVWVYRALGNFDVLRDCHDSIIFLIWAIPFFVLCHDKLYIQPKYSKV
jgi:hypothetical protein